MDRVRRAAVSALVVGVAAGSVASPAFGVDGGMPLATVAWPTSTLLISEVETGGASASDEFIELTNAGLTPVDLGGLEVVYVTSSGSTVTRKATWSALLLDPGRHVLIANSAGVHVAIGDVTYSGGLAATGGVVVLRPVGGTPFDAVGWGDAVNAFVEGNAVAAPAPGTSVERLPGGAAGNAVDTNDNAADFIEQTLPSPQNLASPPTPDPLATPSPTPTGSSTPSPSATPPPSTAPTATPSPSATPPPSTTPTPTPVATPTPTPPATPTPPPVTATIAQARSRSLGSAVVVEGIVTAEAGRLGIAAVVAIQDATAGIAVRLPDAFASVARGTRVRVSGTTAAPYGQLEIRSITEVVVLGEASVPAAIDVSLGEIGEDVEARLVSVHGTVDSAVSRSASGDLAFDVLSADGRARVVADSTSSVARTDFVRDGTYDFVGVVGQRESQKGRNDGYRLWLRDIRDVTPVAAPVPTPTPKPAPSSRPSPTPKPSNSPDTPVRLTIAKALLTRDKVVRIEGRVTAPATLLDATGRRIVIEDATAAIEVYLSAGARAPSLGASIAVDGKVVRAYGAPRLRATATHGVDGVPAVRALRLNAAPGQAYEWRLVTVAGTVTDVHRLGDRWRAEITLGTARVPVAGLAGSGIAATALVEGRRATVTGIVKRAYPGAADRRFAIVPRSRADIELASTAATSAASAPSAAPSANATDKPAGRSTVTGGSSAVDADIADLADHVGQVVRVGGLVASLEPDGVTLDDGTAIGRAVFRGPAADLLPLLEVGDVINVTGRVERSGDELVVAVTDAAGIARVGDPTATDPAPLASPASIATDAPNGTVAAAASSFGPFGVPGPGLATVGLLSLTSAVMTLVLRRGARARLVEAAARAGRLAARTRHRAA